ncbi:MAG: type II secretion system protein [Helicobacteraceae bacterium]|nr:type II secretion system protein [Helicobacteraceae bacterium]
MRKAFTMLEMVFVIVITGLVAIAGSMAIVQIMQNYAIQKEYAKMELDGTSAILQISKYLQDSVWDSIAIRNGNAYTDISSINKRDMGQLKDNKELVFISKNMDALNGYFGTYQGSGSNLPFFSGFIDLSNSNGTTLTTAFSQDKLLSLKNLVGKIGVYFPFVNKDGTVVDKYYSNTSNSGALFRINNINSDTTMTLGSSPSKIGDIAIIVNTTPVSLEKNNNGDLILDDGTDQTLAQGVSNFYIWSEAQSGLLRVRLCFTNKTMDFMPEFCKEGVIMQ